MPARTTTDLLADVKRACFLPSDEDTELDADLLSFATSACVLKLAPVLCFKGSEYYVRDKDTALVASEAGYRLPARAVLGKLRDLLIVDAAGVERDVTECNAEDAWRYGATPGTPVAYYFRGEHVRLLPPPSTAGDSLRMRYYLRRPKLVAVDAAPRITAIDTGARVITASIPSTWTTASTVDLIRAGGLCDHLGIDLVVSAVDGGFASITLAAALPSDLAVGDYVSLSDEASLVCLPEELYEALVAFTASRQLQASADPRWQVAEGRGKEELAAVAKLFAPRNDGEGPRLINHHSPLRGGRRARRWG